MAFDFLQLAIEGSAHHYAMHPEQVRFPTLVFMTALSKDLIDIITGGFLGILTLPPTALIIFLWMKQKGILEQPALKKKLKTEVIKTVLWEIPPFASMMIATTRFVWRVYQEEKKLAKGQEQ